MSYGIDNYSFTAPSVTTVLRKLRKGHAASNLPSAAIDISASANLGLSHSDDFTAIVQKNDGGHAFLYLMRARKGDISGGVSVGAQVIINAVPGLTLNQPKLQNAVDNFTQGQAGAMVVAVCGQSSGQAQRQAQ